jgi:type I site-specific restriction endonuclease
MSTLLWMLGTNSLTAFVVWRLMAFYARNLPAVLDRTNGSKLHEFLDEEDVKWIQEQLKDDALWLRKTGSAGRPRSRQRSSSDLPSEEASGLGLFVRSLVGLDREAAIAAFEDFLAGRALSANQLHFVNLVIAGLTESGVLEPGRLYESPFTDVAPQGPDRMFPSDDVESLLNILVEVKAHAIPAAEVGSAS